MNKQLNILRPKYIFLMCGRQWHPRVEVDYKKKTHTAYRHIQWNTNPLNYCFSKIFIHMKTPNTNHPENKTHKNTNKTA